MANPTTLWTPGRKLFYISILVLDVLLLIAHATEHLQLKEVNESIQGFLRNYGPAAFRGAFEGATKHCWVAYYSLTDPFSSCDDDENADRYLAKQLDPKLTKSLLGREWKLPDGANKNDIDEYLKVVCQTSRDINFDGSQISYQLREEIHRFGCKNYNPTGFDHIYKFFDMPGYILRHIWGNGYAIVLPWVLGFLIVILVSPPSVLMGIILGPIIGSLLLLPILWTLEGLTFLLDYALGLIVWANGAIVVLDVFREFTKFPKEWKEDREKIQGSNEAPASAEKK